MRMRGHRHVLCLFLDWDLRREGIDLRLLSPELESKGKEADEEQEGWLKEAARARGGFHMFSAASIVRRSREIVNSKRNID